MAGNRDIHGSVVLDVEVEGEERARARLQDSFAKLNATVNVNADFNRVQVQAAMDKVAGKGIKVAVNAAFNLTQMRAAAKAAASKGNGVHVNVNAKFNRQQIQRELIASSAGVRIPVLVQAIQDGTSSGGRGGISEKLAREYRLAAQAAASDPAAARIAANGVNKRIGSFQASSLRMKEITKKSELDRLALHEKTNAALKLSDDKAMRESHRRLDKLTDERRKDAQEITKITHAEDEKRRTSASKTADHLKKTEADVNAAIDKGLAAQRVHAEKENEKRVTTFLNSEAVSEHKKEVLQERGNQNRLTSNARVLGRLEIRQDAHFKRINELEQASALRREVIEAQLRARVAAADRAFEQRRQLALERAERAQRSVSERPILQRVLINTDQINSSLTEFDRTVTRVLRTTLLAFGVWSVGVEAAVVGAVAAGAVAFGRLEEAGVRAGAVVASQVRADEFIKGGKAVSDFANVTAAAQEKITDNAQRIALATTGFAPTQVIEGTRALLQAGQDLPSALTNIGAAARFAQVNQMDLAESSDLLAAGLAAAGKKAEYSNTLLDQISFTAQSALGDASEYLEAFANRGASSFRTYGEGIQETLTLLALLGQTGVKGRSAGTQASIVIRDIAKAAQKSPEAFKAYGIAVKSATTPNVTFNETLLSLAAAIEQAQKGNRIAALRKELGFMDRSFGSILQVIPQVNELGATGLDNFAKGLTNSAGSVNRQVAEINKTLPAQFDKVGDAINIALGKLGEQYGDQLTDIFDEFAGPGGLIDRATPELIEFGGVVADVLEDVLGFVQSDDFIDGMETLKEAVSVTLAGVSDAFAAFTGEFTDGEEASTTFEAIADAILAFSQVSATVLPVVARIIGRIFDTLIDHADAFETFAKLALGVYAVRKAYALLVKPAGAAALALIRVEGALAANAATMEGGAILNGLTAMATKLGIVTGAADAATAAVAALTAAEIANASAEVGVGAAGAAADASRANRVSTSARGTGGIIALEGAAELLSNRSLVGRVGNQQKAASGFAKAMDAMNPSTAKVSKLALIFGKLEAGILRVLPAALKTAPVVGRLTTGFAKFAGPVGLVVLAIEAAIGVFQGFFDELDRGSGKTSEFSKTMVELEPIFNAVWETVKFAVEGVINVLAIVGRVAKSVGRVVGSIVNDMVVGLGDTVRGFKLLFEGDLIGALEAFGDVVVNMLTQPFRLAIGLVIDLVGDVIESIAHVDKLLPGSPVRDVADAIHGAAGNVRDFRLNMSEAEEQSDRTTEAVKKTGEASVTAAQQMAQATNMTVAQSRAAVNANSAAFQNILTNTALLRTAVTGTFATAVTPAVQQSKDAVVGLDTALGAFGTQLDVTSAQAATAWGNNRLGAYQTQAQVEQLRGKIAAFGQRAGAAIGGVHGKLVGMAGGAGFAATQVGGIKGAFYQMQSAAAGTIAATITDLAALGNAADEARRKVMQARGDAAVAAAAGQGLLSSDPFISIQQQGLINGTVNNPQIMAYQERIRREALIRRQVRQQARDGKIVADEQRRLGLTPPDVDPAAGGGSTPSAAQPIQRTFVDPDEAIQAAIDRLKPTAKIAQVNALVTKFTTDATASTERARSATNKFTGDAARGYQLTRRDTLLLADAMPRLDAALEAQRGKVQKLEEALTSLRNVQLAGTKAFSDAAFENDQAVKRLQLQRLDLLAAGNTEGSAPVIDVDKQIKDLQAQAERATLVESLELDPLRRKLEETFNPVKEDSFENIIAQFTAITAAQQTQTDKLTAQEAVHTRLNAALTAAQTRYEKIDAAAAKSVESFNAAQQAAAGTATQLTAVGDSATAGAAAVNTYSGAVENVPSGKGVVDKSLKGINERVIALVPQFAGAGDKVMTAFLAGINRTWGNRVQPALVAIVNSIPLLLDNAVPGATDAGTGIMQGFQNGMIRKMGVNADGSSKFAKGSIADYLHNTIPDWIRANKGPVSYDATILVPAGHAVMEGFGKGLRQGFGEIQSFVQGIGPSISEYVTTDAFSDVTASIMADIAVGKTPDINALMGELVPDIISVGAAGSADPTLGFLHATSSALDTLKMAQRLAATFKLPNANITTTNHSQFTSSGNVSDHFYGTAADIAQAGVQTPTPEKDAIFNALSPLVGTVVKQLIYKHTNITAASGKSSWGPSDHMNHVHAAFLKARDFSKDSGRIGGPNVLNFPGASNAIDEAIAFAASKYKFDPVLLGAMAFQESTFRPNVVSADGGYGLMQLTSKSYIDRAKAMGDIFNPYINMDVGAYALRDKVNQNGGNLWAGVKDYNGGSAYPGLIREHMERFRKIFGGYREHGGDVRPGKAYVVGEKRPEIFVPKTAGTILPDASATLSSSTGTTYQDNRTIHNEVHTAASDPEAIVDYLDARTRSRMTGVNFR